MSTKCPQPVAILWDIENCAIPKDVNVEDVAVHINLALKVEFAIQGPIIVFSAFGDSSRLPQHVRQGCHKTGINLIDIPHGKKYLTDKAILVDMFLFALDNPPPCTVVLISGDVDYAPALHKLGQRGYRLVLVIPLSPHVSSALCNACQYVCSWPDMARGKGLNLLKASSLCMIKDCKPLDVDAVHNDKLPKQVALNAKSSFAKGKVQDDKPPKADASKAKNDCIDVAEGKVRSKTDSFEGIAGSTLEAGPSHNDQHGIETSRKIPIGLFEECVKLPLHFAKESSEMPAGTANLCENPVYPTDPIVQCLIDRSINARKVSLNSKHATATCKQAAHVEQSQDTPSQLKVKKKKMKKTKNHSVLEAAPVAAHKKKKKKSTEHCVSEAAPVATPKRLRKQRKAARLAALQL